MFTQNLDIFDYDFFIDPAVMKFIKESRTLIVGFSGGPDSSALLHWLYCLKKTGKIIANIVAVHVNHQLRGQESKRDEEFAVSFCSKRQIEIKIFKADVAKISSQNKENLEETARNIRYDFFNRVLEGFSQALVLTAHNLTDILETFIQRVARGTSLDGLCGIPKIRDQIIRPFANLTKKQLLEFCIKNNVEYVKDSSNDNLAYSRNKVRHKILPILSEINEKYEKNFGRTISLLIKDSEFLNRLARKNVLNSKVKENMYKINNLQPENFSLFSRSVKMIIYDFAKKSLKNKLVNITQKHMSLIYKIVKNRQGTVNIAQNIFLKVVGDIIKIYDDTFVKNTENLSNYCIPVADLLTSELKDFKIELYCGVCGSSFAGNRFFVSFDALPASAVFRSRLPGDRFKPAFRGVTKTLKKLYNEASVPLCLRNVLAVVAVGNDVLWAEGFGASSDSCVGDDTKKALFIKRVVEVWNCEE